MISLHSIFGLVVAAAFLAVAGLGWWRWRWFEPSDAFWRGLRAAQVLYLIYLAIAAVRFFSGERPRDDLYWIYALLPLAVSFMAGQLRISSAAAGLGTRRPPHAPAGRGAPPRRPPRGGVA